MARRAAATSPPFVPHLFARSGQGGSSGGGGGGGVYHVVGISAPVTGPPQPVVAVVSGQGKHHATFVSANGNNAATAGAAPQQQQGGGGEMSPKGNYAYPLARPLACTTVVAWLALILAFFMSVMVIILFSNWRGGPLEASSSSQLARKDSNHQQMNQLQEQIRQMNRRQRLHEHQHSKGKNRANGGEGGTPVNPTFNTGPLVKYQVGLEIRQENGQTMRCGGSIISQDYVLTAAHCIRDQSLPQNILVIPGTDFSDHTLAVWGHATFVHPSYLLPSLGGSERQDIALIKLNQSLVLGQSISAIQLASASSCSGTGCKGPSVEYIASGYGRVSSSSSSSSSIDDENEDLSDILLYTKLRHAEDGDACKEHMVDGAVCVTGSPPAVPSSAETTPLTRSVCKGGDSGGPLVYRQGTLPYLQVAVVSAIEMNPLCIKAGDHAAYTGIVQNRHWIDLVVSGSIVPTHIASSSSSSRSVASSSSILATTAVASGLALLLLILIL